MRYTPRVKQPSRVARLIRSLFRPKAEAVKSVEIVAEKPPPTLQERLVKARENYETAYRHVYLDPDIDATQKLRLYRRIMTRYVSVILQGVEQ